jgi:hypothetical protein
VLLALLAAGCSGSLGIAEALELHIVPGSQSAYPGSGIPRSELADVVEIPDGAPGWLIRIARLEARGLRDEHPGSLTIVLGERYVVTLRGEFVCETCTHPRGLPAPRGRVATLLVDPRRRAVTDFSLRGGD